jgi:hypothetical protein
MQPPKSKLMRAESDEEEEDIDEEELKMFTRLRKISQTKKLRKM